MCRSAAPRRAGGPDRLKWITLDPALALRAQNGKMMMVRFHRMGLALALYGVVALLPAQAEEPAQPDSTAKWLIDRGRTLGLAAPMQSARADAEMIMVWMKAATRTSPQLAEAYRWQYDLAARLGDTDTALAALRSYVRLQPEDAVARLAFIDMSVAQLHTTEDRMEFCRAELATAKAPEVVSDLHRRLAEMHRGRGELEPASDHASRAVEAFAGNAAARQLLAVTREQSDPLETRLDSLLAAIASSGGTGQEQWEVARLLDAASLHKQARSWYQHALHAFQRRDPSYRPSIEFILDSATSAYDGGDYEHALEQCQRARRVDPSHLTCQLLLIRAARKLGRHELADAATQAVRTRCREVESDVMEHADTLSAAQIAWFYLEFDSDPQRAAKFADLAFKTTPEHPAIRRVYGFARLANGDLPEARRALEPIAADNQMAAVGLAQVLVRQGSEDRAVAVLRSAEKLRSTGTAYERITQRLADLGESPSPPPDREGVLKILAGFSEEVLRFQDAPSDYISLEAGFEPEELSFGAPLTCNLTLTNRSPFPVSLGEGSLVSARVLVSVSRDPADSDAPTRYDNYLQIPMAHRYTLGPGESIHVTQTLDVGPVRQLVRSLPLRPCTFTFSFVLDPVVNEAGVWVSRLRRFPTVAARVARRPIDALPQSVDPLIAALTQGTENERYGIVQSLVALLHERQPSHPADPAMPGEARTIKMALRAALASPSPSIRARTVSAIALKLDPNIVGQLAPLLSDPHWMVRLVTADVFASHQERVFEPVLRSLAQRDPDALVRRLASLHLARWEKPPSAAAPAPALSDPQGPARAPIASPALTEPEGRDVEQIPHPGIMGRD